LNNLSATEPFLNILEEIPEGRTRGMGLTRPPEKRENMNDTNEYNNLSRTLQDNLQ